MPHALTTKEVTVSGSEGALAIDFQADRATLHRTRFELVDGTWTPRLGEAVAPHVGPVTPAQVVADELRAFLHCVAARERPEANVDTCGVAMARILDAVHDSARLGRPVAPATGG
jgi:predicted dehydrogenase